MVKPLFILALAATTLAGCSRNKDQAPTIPAEPVTRQTIVVDAEATGVVEPINVIEVKAKSSGQINAMPVETGSFVRAGDLIVQLDTRDTRNAYAQAKADLDASTVRLQVARSARERATELFRERIITSQEMEAAQMEHANAQATVQRNRAALDLRAQSLEEATVRAPVAGTIIEKTVSLGQVIASGTGTFGGGTTIVKMADLTKVRVRTLVNETDIGNVRAGLPATVTVDAFPDRPFMGTVEKIEPQATVEQSVTMFPVLVSIDNQAGMLMPGMNGEVSIQIERRDNVLAIPNEAIRSMNEIALIAPILGLDADSVRATIRGGGRGAQFAGGPAARLNGGGGGPPSAFAATPPARTGGAQAQRGGSARAAGGNLPQVTDQQCEQVAAALAKDPAATTRLRELREQMLSGAVDRETMQRETQKIYAAAGVDPAVARACGFRNRDGQGGGAAGAAGSAGAALTAGAPGAASQSRGRRGLVFVVKDGKYEPRMVRLGVSNFDFAEVLDGLQEGEQVALLNVAVMQAQQQQSLDQIRGRTGMPGLQRQQGGQGGQGGQTGQGGQAGQRGAGGRAGTGQ